ncbi:MAG: FecR family protein [Adhaeribacter sp.]
MTAAILYWFVIKPREIVLATSFGQTKEFTLPDGSLILLNANSKLTYKDNWKDHNDREVWLSGEGFFEIKPKKNKQKFIVHADNLYVEVLGTSFNVYNRRKEIQVVLKEGKVALSEEHSHHTMLLKPGDLVSYQGGDPAFVKKQVNPEDYLAWKKNLLSFREESLGNIFRLLADNYNLQITAEDPAILHRKFTGTVPAGDLSILFAGLQEGHHLKIIQTGNKILVKDKFK